MSQEQFSARLEKFRIPRDPRYLRLRRKANGDVDYDRSFYATLRARKDRIRQEKDFYNAA